jgi:phenylacetic acid degradation operon negative regulatory protein
MTRRGEATPPRNTKIVDVAVRAGAPPSDGVRRGEVTAGEDAGPDGADTGQDGVGVTAGRDIPDGMGGPDGATGSAAVRPQSLAFTFLGNYVLGRNICVFSGSYIEVFERVGISEQATRSTLTRMVNRGLLRRHRGGRRMYFGLTPRTEAILTDGAHRMWQQDVVNRDWDGMWTLLGFSLPESWQRERHDLRSRLTWAGFGPILSGLWIAPSPTDVDTIVAELGLGAYVKVFTASPRLPADPAQLLREAYDLDGLARRYRDFLRRWEIERPLPDAPDDLARKLLLLTEWLQLIRRDPRLPADHLPPDWPAIRARRLVYRLHEAFSEQGDGIAAEVLDTIEVAPPVNPPGEDR